MNKDLAELITVLIKQWFAENLKSGVAGVSETAENTLRELLIAGNYDAIVKWLDDNENKLGTVFYQHYQWTDVDYALPMHPGDYIVKIDGSSVPAEARYNNGWSVYREPNKTVTHWIPMPQFDAENEKVRFMKVPDTIETSEQGTEADTTAENNE